MSECSIHTAECCFYAAILHETNLLWIRKWEASDLNYRWIIVHLGFVCAWLNCEALLYFSAYHYPVITITILPRLPPSFSIVCFVGRFEADYHHIIEQIKQSPCLYTTRHTYNTDVVVVISSHTLFESGLIVLAFFFSRGTCLHESYVSLFLELWARSPYNVRVYVANLLFCLGVVNWPSWSCVVMKWATILSVKAIDPPVQAVPCSYDTPTHTLISKRNWAHYVNKQAELITSLFAAPIRPFIDNRVCLHHLIVCLHTYERHGRMGKIEATSNWYQHNSNNNKNIV